MSSPGIRDQLASALQAQGGNQPPSQGNPAPAAAAAPQQGGGLAALAQAYGRCEQTKQCSPQDRAVLQDGLPKLVQMAKNIQQILAATAGGGQPQPGGAPQPPAPGGPGGPQ